MKKIKFNLKNCYGIKSLDEELNFSNRTFAIYAPNGVMKTSFAKTLRDVATNSQTRDLVFPERETVREILVDNIAITSDKVFVIETYKEDYQSDKVSTLLANKLLKEEYEKIHKDIDKAKDNLFKSLKKSSGLNAKGDPISAALSDVFKKSIFELIFDLEAEVSGGKESPLSKIEYAAIFNGKTIDVLKSEEFKAALEEYIQKYDELIEKSPILRKDFKPHHAVSVQEQLSKNNFFKAGHSINLSDGSQKTEYSSDEELANLLEHEKAKVLNDGDLRKRFDGIDDKLSKNKDLQEFRNYLLNNKNVLAELGDLTKLARDLWLAYFIEQKSAFLDLLAKYKTGQDEIGKLVARAKAEKTDWEEVVRIFNSRFSHLPFQLQIKNREDVILKGSVESIEFIFRDSSTHSASLDRDTLLKVLSTGEKRALYILNIIFEVEVRKKAQENVLFVVDDIADSFDYKNKYAIIEYLKHMSEVECFRMIILTHNFDFFRTIESRKVSAYSQCLISIKNDSGVKLLKMEGLKNPFIKDWKNNLNDKKKLVASIPFVRNLIEYKEGEAHEDYLTLTSVLHMKDATENITIQKIGEIFTKTVSNINFPTQEATKKISDFVFEAAEECLVADEGVNLENKIVLSIAIRLKAEVFMKSKITDQDVLNGLENSSNQTWNLIKAYEEEFNNETNNIEILKRVNLITPENIHVNSFMYEPILDMGDGELRDLYTAVKFQLI
jgi:hypothetical protein